MYNKIITEINSFKNSEKKIILQRFFKTGPGEYGEGDIFLGLTNPIQRNIAKKYKDLALTDVKKLLISKYHEYRMIALFILIHKYPKNKKEIFDIYLNNTKHINNWDLVDLSAPNIVGDYLLDKDRKILYQLAKSNDLWEKRISILATFTFIRNNEYKDTLAISEILLNDKHDLIHKAVGWMLRELGKRVLQKEEEFLDRYSKVMPRTMLRYAIERFDENKRKKYMKK